MMNLFLRVLVAGWLAVTLVFWGLRALPGDAIRADLTFSGASETDIADRQRALGLDRPVSEQYIHFVASVASGDLGTSLRTGERVSDMLAFRLGSTLSLASVALSVAVGAGGALALASISRLAPIRMAAAFLTQLALSVPLMVSATLLIVVVGLFPPESPGNLLLAAGVLGFHTSSSIAIVLGDSLHQVQRSTILLTAHGKGLPKGIILRRHVLRIAILPVIPVIASQAAFLLGGTVLTETLFGRTGLGRLMLDATLSRDLPVVQGVAIVAVLFTLGAVLTAGFAQHLADPRLRA